MRFAIGLALAAALGATGCKKNGTSGSGSAAGSAAPVATVGSGSATTATTVAATGSAAAIADAAIPIDAASGPWSMPAGAAVGSADADATGLGSAVVVHFVEHVVKPKPHEKTRTVKLLLVLEGGGKAIIADETGILGADDRWPAAMTTKVESDIIRAPLTPPRPLQLSDIEGGGDYELEFKGPLLFLVHIKPKAEVHEVAVGKVNDSLVVWLLQIPFDDVDAVPEWDVTGTIKLAPGAVATAAGSGS